jgi:hypothetical protein
LIIYSRNLAHIPKNSHHKIMGNPSAYSMTGFLLGTDMQSSLQLWREQTILAAYKGNGNTATGE